MQDLTSCHQDILLRYERGHSGLKISRDYRVRSNRIYDILNAHGVIEKRITKNRNKRIPSESDQIFRLEKINKNFLEVYGCTLFQFKEVQLFTSDKARTAFNHQRKKAKKRGIEWKFKFWDWWLFWHESGHWNERGCLAGQYVMARFKDRGPYSKDNVEIITCNQNSKDAVANTRHRKMLANPSPPSARSLA